MATYCKRRHARETGADPRRRGRPRSCHRHGPSNRGPAQKCQLPCSASLPLQRPVRPTAPAPRVVATAASGMLGGLSRRLRELRRSGETYAEAIRRRTREELGIALDGFTVLGKSSMVDERSKKFVTVFSGVWTGPFHLDSSHISEASFLSLADIFRIRNSEAWTFTPAFVKLVDLFFQRVDDHESLFDKARRISHGHQEQSRPHVDFLQDCS